jgi:hypothetical protein
MPRCLLLFVAPLLGAADFTTELSVGAQAAGGGELTCVWQVIAKAPGAGEPQVAAILPPLPGQSHRVRMLLPDARAGTYLFAALLSDGALQTISNQVMVTVQAPASNGDGGVDSVPSAASEGGGAGGCGAGAGIAVLLGLSLAGSLRQRIRHSRG